MKRPRTSEWLALALASVPMTAPSLALADVLEIGLGGPTWIVGGPPSAVTLNEIAPANGELPLTLVDDAAGPQEWRGRVAQLAAKYDISPTLLEALVWQESRWHTDSVSSAGARGLAQLMPATARQMGVNPTDPHANLEGGARYLRMQLDTFDGDVEKALAADNAGPRRVHAAGGIPRIRETQNYVASIMARLTDPVRR